MNLYKEHFRHMVNTFRYEFINTEIAYVADLKCGSCIDCREKTVIPFDVCLNCINKRGFAITSEFNMGIKTTIARKQDEVITDLPYIGDIMSKKQLNKRYGKTFAPYSIKYRTQVIDASTKRCFLSIINSDTSPNAQFIIKNGQILLQFIKDVEAGNDIYVYYDFKDKYVHDTYMIE